MVGDSEIDFLAARAGDFGHCYLVTTGTHSADDLAAVGVPRPCIFDGLRRLGEGPFQLRWS
jgi:hypothetical protein